MRFVRSRWSPATLLAGMLLLAGCDSSDTPAPSGPVPPLSGPATTPTGSAVPPGPTGPATPAGLPAGGPVPAGFTVTSLTTVAGGITYALGTAPCAAPPCTSVVRSTDGGKSWRGVPAPKAPLPAGAETRDPDTRTVRELRFATPKDGWAYGGGLWSTHDGGARWTRVDVGGSVLDLAGTATATYALVSTCRADGSSCGGTRLLSSAPTRDAFETVGGVTLPATGFGTVSTGAAGVVVAVSGATYVARAGGAFRRVSVPCADPPAEVVAAAGDASVVAFCGDAAAGSSTFTTRVSTDGGTSWVANSAGGGRLPNGLLTFTAATRDRLAIASASRDLRGGLIVSANGGGFTAAAVPASPAGWRYVGAGGAATLVALAQPARAGYWTSSDGGRTWARTAVG